MLKPFLLWHPLLCVCMWGGGGGKEMERAHFSAYPSLCCICLGFTCTTYCMYSSSLRTVQAKRKESVEVGGAGSYFCPCWLRRRAVSCFCPCWLRRGAATYFCPCWLRRGLGSYFCPCWLRRRAGSYFCLYRTSGVIFFIDYCTAIRDT